MVPVSGARASTLDKEPIYHLARAAEFEAARVVGQYLGTREDRADGFIHFSTRATVRASAARHRAGEAGLLLVAVDPTALGAALVWEPARAGTLFPHLYGTLPMAAVVDTVALPLDAAGAHVFPDGF